MSRRLIVAGIVLVILGILATNSLYTVNEAQQALVLRFGEPRQVVQTPGLKVKMPIIEDVTYYEKRILDVDPPVEQVILIDQRRLDVDSFARYKIVDPLAFYQAVRTEEAARSRIATIVNASLRRVLGGATQLAVLSDQRAEIMREIRSEVSLQASRFGIEIIDVRIGRADVPEGTVQSVYDRMRSEREREAREFRAQGEEQAQQIRSRADRERTVILAEAERRAQILRGEADAEAIRIQAEAYSSDPQFFSFYRTLQAYRLAMSSRDTTLVLSPTGDFFKYFNDVGGRGLMPTIEDSTPSIPVIPAPAPSGGSGG